MNYESELNAIDNPTFKSILELSKKYVPLEYKNKLWTHPGLNHGTNLLTTEDAMCCYIAAYGLAHERKLKKVLETFPTRKLDADIEVFDWGCGQGLASVCLVEYLKEKQKLHLLKKITLIEPSLLALQRAELNTAAVTNNCNVTIKKEIKYLPSVRDSPANPAIHEIFVDEPIAIHLFSNILDIYGIDLKKLANIIAASGSRHYLLCMGPINSGNTRIDAFCRYFELDAGSVFSNIYNSEIGHYPSGKAYTCKAKGFELVRAEGKSVLTSISFYPPKQFFAAYALDGVSKYHDDISEPSRTSEKHLTRLKEVERLCAFEVLAPFDIGASIYDDIHPILAVLNNMIIRGLPTKASPFIEEQFSAAYKFSVESASMNGAIRYSIDNGGNISHEYGILRDSPIAIARVQKVVIEAMMTGKISFEKKEWNVLVKEQDVPCAAIAFEDLKDMFNHLTALSEQYDRISFPKVTLAIISEKHSDSPLHLGHMVFATPTAAVTSAVYDMVIDVATTQTTDAQNVTFSEFKALNNCYFNIRSSERINSTRQIYTTDRIIYKPLTLKKHSASGNQQNEYELIPENVIHLRYFLNLLFRKQDFRDGQLPILTRALQHKSVIGLLPTGGGKSLTYQLAAMLQPGICIIVDPLISLMKDQYDGLIKAGMDCCTYINSKVPDKARREHQMESSQMLFVFLSPERLCIYKFRERLKTMEDMHVYFSYGVIDEVHCVSEWGHDFRFSYLHLGRNMYNFVLPKQNPDSQKEERRVTLFGLTATASFDVLADVERELSGNGAFPLDSDCIVRYENTNRLELQYCVLPVTVPDARTIWDVYKEKNRLVPEIISSMRSRLSDLQSEVEVENIKKKFLERESMSDEKQKELHDRELSVTMPEDWRTQKKSNCSAIVFCPNTQGSLGVYDSESNSGVATTIISKLHTEKEKVVRYKGGDDLSVQDKFINGEASIMVATKAFGMGIDKDNVRFTLHVNHSGSLEAFVQEAGRAGRDRKMALAVVLYCNQKLPEKYSNTSTDANDTVDYGVHKLFLDGSFMGIDFEECVQNFLLNRQQPIYIRIGDYGVNPPSRTVSSFITELINAEPETRIMSYFSYEYITSNGKRTSDSQELDKKLRDLNLSVIGSTRNTVDDKAERYLEAQSKAIYRMCCVGVIDDYTQDYNYKAFRIVTKKKADGGYYQCLKMFLMRYYNENRADFEMQRAQNFRGDNEIQKCLNYLTEFIYDKTARKRKQAIVDMEAFCNTAINSGKDWIETNEHLKDFIYYYFNSKYARDNYITETGEGFSLTEDTDRGKESSFEILFKYLRVVDDDVAGSSSPKDNIKHLQGAVRLIRRSLTDSNPAIDFLNVYCLLFLKTNGNDNLQKELMDSYIRGYMDFYFRTEAKILFYGKIADFKAAIVDNGRNAATKEEIQQLKVWDMMAELEIHAKAADALANRYARLQSPEISF